MLYSLSIMMEYWYLNLSPLLDLISQYCIVDMLLLHLSFVITAFGWSPFFLSLAGHHYSLWLVAIILFWLVAIILFWLVAIILSARRISVHKLYLILFFIEVFFASFIWYPSPYIMVRSQNARTLTDTDLFTQAKFISYLAGSFDNILFIWEILLINRFVRNYWIFYILVCFTK